MAGTWGTGGSVSIGIFDPVAGLYTVKPSSVFGTGESAPSAKLPADSQALDGPTVWHKRIPSRSAFITYEVMPSNDDYPYGCAGQRLLEQNPYAIKEDGCPQLFKSMLTLWSYDYAGKVWERSGIDEAWAMASVKFAYERSRNADVVVYYNADREVEVALRTFNNGAWSGWSHQVLDSLYKGWDNHHTLHVEVDENDDIHVAGNIHNDPMNYWRSDGLDVATLQRRPMPVVLSAHPSTGEMLERTTYPTFLRGPKGEFLFSYREGATADGDWYINVYDINTKTWSQLLDVPLFSGMNP